MHLYLFEPQPGLYITILLSEDGLRAAWSVEEPPYCEGARTKRYGGVWQDDPELRRWWSAATKERHYGRRGLPYPQRAEVVPVWYEEDGVRIPTNLCFFRGHLSLPPSLRGHFTWTGGDGLVRSGWRSLSHLKTGEAGAKIGAAQQLAGLTKLPPRPEATWEIDETELSEKARKLLISAYLERPFSLAPYRAPEEATFEVPMVWEVCTRCRGEGSHVNPAVEHPGGGLTQGEWAEACRDDEDFAANYFGGVYDVRCEECGGRTTVLVVPSGKALREHLGEDMARLLESHLEEMAWGAWEMAAERAAERRAGCG